MISGGRGTRAEGVGDTSVGKHRRWHGRDCDPPRRLSLADCSLLSLDYDVYPFFRLHVYQYVHIPQTCVDIQARAEEVVFSPCSSRIGTEGEWYDR